MNNQDKPSLLSQHQLHFEHGDDVPFLRMIGAYKRYRRQRAARQPKEAAS